MDNPNINVRYTLVVDGRIVFDASSANCNLRGGVQPDFGLKTFRCPDFSYSVGLDGKQYKVDVTDVNEIIVPPRGLNSPDFSGKVHLRDLTRYLDESEFLGFLGTVNSGVGSELFRGGEMILSTKTLDEFIEMINFLASSTGQKVFDRDSGIIIFGEAHRHYLETRKKVLHIQ